MNAKNNRSERFLNKQKIAKILMSGYSLKYFTCCDKRFEIVL